MPRSVPIPTEFDPEFVAGLKSMFEEKILFNKVIGLKVTSLRPDGVTGRVDMKNDLIGHFAYNRLHGGVSCEFRNRCQRSIIGL